MEVKVHVTLDSEVSANIAQFGSSAAARQARHPIFVSLFSVRDDRALSSQTMAESWLLRQSFPVLEAEVDKT